MPWMDRYVITASLQELRSGTRSRLVEADERWGEILEKCKCNKFNDEYQQRTSVATAASNRY